MKDLKSLCKGGKVEDETIRLSLDIAHARCCRRVLRELLEDLRKRVKYSDKEEDKWINVEELRTSLYEELNDELFDQWEEMV